MMNLEIQDGENVDVLRKPASGPPRPDLGRYVNGARSNHSLFMVEVVLRYQSEIFTIITKYYS